jgi:hypothetical protein
MSLIIEKFTDEELMGEVFIFFSVGGYPQFYEVYKITKKQVYLVRLEATINFDYDDGDCRCHTYKATKIIYNNGGVSKPEKKIIKRDEIDDCNWGNSYTHKSYIWE